MVLMKPYTLSETQNTALTRGSVVYSSHSKINKSKQTYISKDYVKFGCFAGPGICYC